MRRSKHALVGLTLALSIASDVLAQDPTAEAAEAFDRGVKHYEAAEFDLAAKAFARADELVPAPNALKNAIAAARKAGAWLLVTELAERAEARAAESPDVAASAREALSEARRKLARVDLKCVPEPCALALDGEKVEPGLRWMLPGNRVVRATAEGGARAEERLRLEADTLYRVVLHPVAAGAAPIAAQVSKAPQSQSSEPPPKDRADERRPLSPTVFYIGVAASGALAAATIWSGFDAVNAKNDLPDDPSSSETDAVRSKVLRTDLLLAGTVVLSGLTAYAGLSLVEWDSGRASAAIVPIEGGAFANVEARF